MMRKIGQHVCLGGSEKCTLWTDICVHLNFQTDLAGILEEGKRARTNVQNGLVLFFLFS